jgi:DNA repair exonuclease SbcCD nuclease subunit
MAKIALINDTHWGARGDSVAFTNYFNKFYDEVFFPYLREHNIKRIIHGGDVVDRRKFINYATAKALRGFFGKCEEDGIESDVIVGNHDAYFKNTNEVNSINELFSHSNYNVRCYSDPVELEIDGLKIALLPWVCSGNYVESMKFIENTTATVLYGHLELTGFEMYRGAVNDHGMDPSVFSKFQIVMSGHFHTKSTKKNIHYLGAPYEMTWSDYDDARGFHVFDTETLELTYIKNPYSIFHKVYYNDLDKTLDEVLNFDPSVYTNTFVKLVVRNKSNPYWLDMVVEKLEAADVLDLQIIEDNIGLALEDDSDTVDEADDTLVILKKYVDQLETNVDRGLINKFISDLHHEALNLE